VANWGHHTFIITTIFTTTLILLSSIKALASHSGMLWRSGGTTHLFIYYYIYHYTHATQ
jgi:hypothetical protein